MKIRFLQDFSAQTASGARLIAAGTVLDLDEAKAAPLIRAGVAEPAGRDPPGSSSPAAVDLLARNDNRKLTTCDNRILTTPSVGRSAGSQGVPSENLSTCCRQDHPVRE